MRLLLRWTFPILLVLAGVLFVLRCLQLESSYLHGALFDDAYISLRHAWVFAQGHGFNYNVGERVEGYTNFLQTALMAGTLSLDATPELTIKALGVASGVGTVMATGLLARRMAGPAAGVALALGLAANGGAAVLALSGMETLLFSLLHTVAFLLLFTGRFVPSALLFALAAMTRMEAVLLFAVALLYRALVGRGGDQGEDEGSSARSLVEAVLPMLAAFAGVFGSYFAIRWAYYGYLLPNTFYAKVVSSAATWERGLGYLERAFSHTGLSGFAGLGALAACGVVAMLLTGSGEDPGTRDGVARRRRTQIATLALGSATYLAYLARVGGDHHYTFGDRFLYQALPLLIVAATGALAEASGATMVWAAKLRGGRREPAESERVSGLPRLRPVLAFLFASWAAIGLATSACPRLMRSREGVLGWMALGRYLAAHSGPDDLVATTAAGAIVYYSGLPAIDMYGLANVEIAHDDARGHQRGGPGHQKLGLAYTLSRRPRYIALWLPARGSRPEIAGYQLTALVRMDGLEDGDERVLETRPDVSREVLSALRRGSGPVPGQYAFALLERTDDEEPTVRSDPRPD